MLIKKFFTPLLAPVSWGYRAGVWLDRYFKERSAVTLPKTVVSIGNLTMGGTGKTPLLLRLAADLAHQGLRPAVLSRGYRGPFRKIHQAYVKGAEFTGVSLSEEILLMAKQIPNVPLGVGPDRVRSATDILKRDDVDCFLLDDGFQHWRIRRDTDIVCVDSTDPWGDGHLAPRGRLREPFTGLARAHVVAITRAELRTAEEIEVLKVSLQQWAPQAVFVSVSFRFQPVDFQTEEKFNPAGLKGQTVLAVSGIGRPEAYEQNLRQHGANVIPLRFPDHHVYSENDLLKIERESRRNHGWVVMTEKDAVKFRALRWRDIVKSPSSTLVWTLSVDFSSEDHRRWMQVLHDIKNNTIHH